MPNLVQLLGSKNQFDVVETIKLMIVLSKYNVQSSEVLSHIFFFLKKINNIYHFKYNSLE
jgi:hypothetical protein